MQTHFVNSDTHATGAATHGDADRRMRTTTFAVIIGFLAMPMVVTAQFPFGGGFRDYDSFYSNTQAASSRMAEQTLEKAKSDVTAREFERAVRLIQSVLDEHAQASITTGERTTQNLREYCHRFLEELPKEGFDTYRRIFDPYAEAAYMEAMENHDLVSLRSIYTRYFLTSWGRKALEGAAALYFERGELFESEILARLYLETPAEGDSIRAASMAAMVVLSLEATGDLKGIERFAESESRNVLDVDVKIAGRPTTVRKIIDAALARRDSAGKTPEFIPGPRTFAEPQWRASFDLNEQQESTSVQIFDFGEPIGGSRAYLYNPVVPTIGDNAVYWSNGLTIRAANLYSGEDRWRRPVTGPAMVAQARRNLSVTFPVTYDRGVLYASLESPVREENRIAHFRPYLPIPHRQLYAVDAGDGSVLWRHAGYDGGNAAQNDFIATLNINSAPLVIGDHLFVAGTRFHTSYHQYLCCFDRRTGALEWSTFVCTGQMEQNMFGNRVRECIAGEIAEADGLLWFSTNLGVVAAVDARLGTLRFVTPYEQTPIPRQRQMDMSIYERAPGWANCRPVVWRDWVYVAPMDSQDLLRINRHSGKSTMVMSRDPRKPAKWLVGEYRDRLIVAGAAMTFYDCESGKKMADLQLSMTRDDRRGGVQGPPVICGSKLYAVIRFDGAESLNVWDLDTLNMGDAIRLPSDRTVTSGTNLAIDDRTVVLTTVDERRDNGNVRCYFDRMQVKALAAAQLAAEPENPLAFLRAGEIALQERDFAAAVKHCEQAARLVAGGSIDADVEKRVQLALLHLYLNLAVQPTSVRTTVGIDNFECYERALTQSRTASQKLDILFLLLKDAIAAKDQKRFEDYASRLIANHGEQPYEYVNEFQRELPYFPVRTFYRKAGLLALALWAGFDEENRRYDDAVTRWQEVIRRFPEETIGTINAWRLSWTRIESLLETHGREIYAKHEKEAQSLFDDAERTGQVAPLERLLRDYPNSSRVVSSYVAIARHCIAAKNFDAGVKTIQDFLWRMGKPSGIEIELLADALSTAGMTDSATDVWNYARDVVADAVLDESSGRTLGEVATAKVGKAKKATREDGYALPALGKEITENWRLTAPEDSSWSIVGFDHARSAGPSDRIFVHAGEALSCVTIADGKIQWSAPCGDRPDTQHVAWSDNRMYAVLDGDLTAIEPKTGREFWRTTFGIDIVQAITTGFGKVFAIVEHPVATGFRLQVRHAFDGKLIYETWFSGSPAQEIDRQGRWIAVTVLDERRVWVIDAMTGRVAAAMPQGVEFNDVIQPVLNAAGHLVYVKATPNEADRELRAVDPESGRALWSRNLGEGSIRIAQRDAWTYLYDRALTRAQRANTRSTFAVSVIDLIRGTLLFDRNFEEDTSLRPNGSRFTADDLYLTQRKSVRARTLSFEHYVEDIALSTQSTRWRSVPIPGAYEFRPLPFDGGIVAVVMTYKQKGNRLRVMRTTLLVIDKQTGSITQEIVLDSEEAILERQTLLIGGRLIVADGSVLKGFKP